MRNNRKTAGHNPARENKTPTTGQTVAGATRFQQSKKILAHTLHKLVAIFSMRLLCLGDVLPLSVIVATLMVLEVLK